MQSYTPPLRDLRFVLHELHGTERLGRLPAFADFTPDLYDSILEAAAKFITAELLPLNASGDAEGCRFETGTVTTPKGFKEAYRRFCAAGWPGLDAPPELGGQGVPVMIAKLVEEMICSANLSFGLYPGLSHGAYVALRSHGSAALKADYLPKLVDGSWSGTMCLTEAHCGTDLGLLRSRAVPADAGSYRLTGNKIFISAGEHDLTENIIHLVLARLPGAPPGIKGISLFLVPKFLPTADGGLGPRNGVTCIAIEHKMGIKASATCQIAFEDATGWLVGEPHKGMAAMFTMMNSERLAVGAQGLGIGEVAYQNAVAYARERRQGRPLTGPQAPGAEPVAIIGHPDVRRMLMTMRAYNEGCRALGMWVGQALDVSEHDDDPLRRREAADLLALMTPIVKALFTDLGFESANLGVQVFGGHGYIQGNGMEQYVRDARIAMIYEGTNGIQALDLVGRKLPAHTGRYLRAFFHPVLAFIDEHLDDPAIGAQVQALGKAFGALQLATAQIAQTGLRDAEEAGAAATDYLRLFGLVALGFMWARMAKVAATALDGEPPADAAFYRTKLTTAKFFFDRLLPQAGGLWLAIKSGKASMMALDAEAF